MILPTKHVSLACSYLGAGRTVLQALDRPLRVDALWKAVSKKPNIANTRRFYRILDLLFMLGAITLSGSKIKRV